MYVVALAGLRSGGANALRDGAGEEGNGFVGGGQIHGGLRGGNQRVDGPLPVFECCRIFEDLAVGVIYVPETEFDGEGEVEGCEVEHYTFIFRMLVRRFWEVWGMVKRTGLGKRRHSDSPQS